MKYSITTALSALPALGVAAALLAGCGGRFQAMRDDDAGHSGAGSSSGGASGAGSTGRAGASSAGASGGNECNNVNCETPTCPAGTTAQVAPGDCCATCAPCPCPLHACAAGTHPETLAGSCCPICIDDGGAACEMGRQSYASERYALLNKYQYGCASNRECVLVTPSNLCEPGCAVAAVWYELADSFASNLASAADKYCSSCTPVPVPPCDRFVVAECVMGQCQLRMPL